MNKKYNAVAISESPTHANKDTKYNILEPLPFGANLKLTWSQRLKLHATGFSSSAMVTTKSNIFSSFELNLTKHNKVDQKLSQNEWHINQGNHILSNIYANIPFHKWYCGSHKYCRVAMTNGFIFVCFHKPWNIINFSYNANPYWPPFLGSVHHFGVNLTWFFLYYGINIPIKIKSELVINTWKVPIGMIISGVILEITM